MMMPPAGVGAASGEASNGAMGRTEEPSGTSSSGERRPPSAGTSRPVYVGIGASAGALGALEQLFSVVPADSGLVFVLVQHLERHHPSVLTELLAKHTRMPVQQAEDGMGAQPNHVYVIPPNAVLTLEQGVLRVARPAEPGLRTPIDTFFRSLARDQHEHAAGVVLSGAGSDGTAGLRSLKEHGGLTLAQSPETAKYDSMPLSAIAAGLVDFAVPVDEMPARLVGYARRLADLERGASEALEEQVTAQQRQLD